MTSNNQVIVFDLGGVLIEWDPRHMYRKLFDDKAEMERFLAEVATNEWNAQHDAGRRWEDGVALLSAQHPHLAGLISAYWERWEEMLAGPIDGTVAILASLRDAGYELHALTNWSTQTFPIARERYEFLDWFETIVVSGEEKVIKPDPRIYEILLERIGREATECVFIDDAPRNVATAKELGFSAIRFENPDQLRAELGKLGVKAQSSLETP
jgi:2-haloacid dehalogenase